MKISFVEPKTPSYNFYSWAIKNLPLLGPIYLGTILKNEGHDVTIYNVVVVIGIQYSCCSTTGYADLMQLIFYQDAQFWMHFCCFDIFQPAKHRSKKTVANLLNFILIYYHASIFAGGSNLYQTNRMVHICDTVSCPFILLDVVIKI